MSEPRPQIVEYIRQLLGQYDDAAIRAQLAKEGVPQQEIDAAFLAAKEPARALPPPPSFETNPPSRPRRKVLPIVIVVLALVGAAFAALRWRAVRAKDARALQANDAACPAEAGTPAAGRPTVQEMTSYASPLYADPADIDSLFKTARVPGSVEADVVEALRLMVEMFDADLKEMQDTPENMERLRGAIGAISRALKMRGEGWTGGVLAPKTTKQLAALITLNGSLLPQFDRILRKETQKALEEGRLEDAEGFGRKRLALGWMMMQDWAALSQSFGLVIANGGLLAMRDAKVAQKRYCAADRQTAFRVAKQLMAFTAQPDELKKLQAAVADGMPRFEVLQKYLDDPILRPRYADAALSYAAHEGTRGPAQIESARAEFLRAASGHADPRVARLANGYALVHADHNKPAAEASLKEAALNLIGPAPADAAAAP